MHVHRCTCTHLGLTLYHFPKTKRGGRFEVIPYIESLKEKKIEKVKFELRVKHRASAIPYIECHNETKIEKLKSNSVRHQASAIPYNECHNKKEEDPKG